EQEAQILGFRESAFPRSIIGSPQQMQIRGFIRPCKPIQFNWLKTDTRLDRNTRHFRHAHYANADSITDREKITPISNSHDKLRPFPSVKQRSTKALKSQSRSGCDAANPLVRACKFRLFMRLV